MAPAGNAHGAETSARSAENDGPLVYFFGVLPTETYNLVGLRQIRPIILIRKVSEWSAFRFVNVDFTHNRDIINLTSMVFCLSVTTKKV